MDEWALFEHWPSEEEYAGVMHGQGVAMNPRTGEVDVTLSAAYAEWRENRRRFLEKRHADHKAFDYELEKLASQVRFRQ